MADRQYLTQAGRPTIEKAFNGLRAITRTYDVNASGTTQAAIESEVFLAYGTADAEFTSALLTKRAMQIISTDKNAYVLRLTEVYQEIGSSKVSVGEDQILRYEDGRTALVRRFVVRAQNAEGQAATIGTILDGRACADVKINKQGFGAEIVETYISAGKLSESNTTSNGGNLASKTLVYFNQEPPTPLGYTLVRTSVQNTEGVPTYTYEFAAGSGEISRQIDYSLSDDEGTTGVTKTVIRHLTATSVSSNPITTPIGAVLIGVDKTDQDGYRVWTANYVKAVGVISTSIKPRDDGLREETWVSVGTKQTPATGVVIRDDEDVRDGYSVFTVTVMQEADGTDPLGATLVIPEDAMFLYPGRAKAYDSSNHVNVFLSPPIEVRIDATHTITYQTSNSLGSVGTRWQPKEWATIRASWKGLGNYPKNHIEALRGYRSVSATAITKTYGSLDTNSGTMLGQTAFGGSTGSLVVTGGPVDPAGNTYTLKAWLDEKPAFVSVAGVPYYRKHVVSATIPAQPSLPV